MTITRQGVGAVSFASSGSPATPGLPASFAANDIFVATILAGNNDVITVPAGWTKKLEIANGTDNRLTVAWRRAQVGDTSPSFSGNSQDILSRIVGYTGCKTSGDPFSDAQGQANASSTTVTAPQVDPAAPGEMVVFTGGRSNLGATVSTFSGYSGTDPTFTEAYDSDNTGGVVFNLAIFAADGLTSSGNATGSRTATASNAGINTAALLSLIPETGGSDITGTVAATETGSDTFAATGAHENPGIRLTLRDTDSAALAANLTGVIVSVRSSSNSATVLASATNETTDAGGVLEFASGAIGAVGSTVYVTVEKSDNSIVAAYRVSVVDLNA